MTQHQQMQQQQIPSGNTEARLGVVEARVGSIMEAIEGLSRKLDARSTINWAPISLLATVLIAFGSLGVGYLSTHQARLEAMITKQDLRAERFVPREDLDKRFEVITQRRDDLQRLSDARVERLERDLDTLQKAMVPRGEHGEVWAAQRMKDEALQRQFDQMRKEVSDLNTPRDTVQGILRRLDELDRERRRGPDPR